MYLGKAEEEDRNLVESWRGDADGMLIFVSLCAASYVFAYDIDIVDRLVLCCCCAVACGIHPRTSAELAGHVSLLPCTYLSAIFSVEWISGRHPIDPVRPHRTIHPTYIRNLDQLLLVLELGDEFYLRPDGDVNTAVGASLSKDCPSTVQPS